MNLFEKILSYLSTNNLFLNIKINIRLEQVLILEN